jgi:hypothetical protein
MPASWYSLQINIGDRVKCTRNGKIQTFAVRSIATEAAANDLTYPFEEEDEEDHHEIRIATVCHGKILETGATASFALEELLRENTRVEISCIDCECRGYSDLHPYGLECGHCGSFNTSRLF